MSLPSPLPRLTRDTAHGRPAGDLVDGWLRVFIGLLRLPGAKADGIREELEGHLRDRARDLMLTGMDEAVATRQAIAELGEAADVAARYRALHTEPRRRLVMYLTLFGTGAAVAMSLVAVAWSGRSVQPETSSGPMTEAQKQRLLQQILAANPHEPTVRVGELLARAHESAAGQQARNEAMLRAIRAAQQSVYVPEGPPPDLEAIKLDVKMEDARLSEVFKLVGAAAKRPIDVEWGQLRGLGPEETVTLHRDQITLPRLLEALSQTFDRSGPSALEARVVDGAVVVTSREQFDRRELKMAIYDLSGIIQARQEAYNEERRVIVEEIIKAITEFVSPEDWVQNGGELAKLQVVGDRLFVSAPSRIHPQIDWILKQLPGAAPEKQGQADSTAPLIRVYALKHVSADEALKELRSMQAIREVDFTRFAADARTNSIIGQETADRHAKVAAAINALDTAEGVLDRRTEETARQQLAMERSLLADLEQARAARQAELDQAVQRYGPGHRAVGDLKARLETLDQQIEQHRARCTHIEQGMLKPRGDAAPRDPTVPTHLYRLQHAAATEVASALRSLYPRWSINADAHTNSVLVAGAPDASSAAAAVAQLDVSGSGAQ